VTPFLLLPALLAADAWDMAGTRLAQSTTVVRERFIVRIPLPGILRRRPPASARPVPPLVKWKTKKGPACVPLAMMAGAQVTAPASIDLTLKGGGRVRAELEDSCPALDYYGGFYLKPTMDGKVCADRDAIHTRAGGACEIERFRKLVPAKP
jgi:hypothetical protein